MGLTHVKGSYPKAMNVGRAIVARDEIGSGKELMLCTNLQTLFAGGALIDKLTNLVVRAAAAISAVDK